jgi:hypothetical protein
MAMTQDKMEKVESCIDLVGMIARHHHQADTKILRGLW